MPRALTLALSLNLAACRLLPEKNALLDQDGDGITFDLDCDDGDPAVHPGASEIWYDGVDQDCDGASDFDADRDGFDQDSDCEDEDPTVNPESEELCGDAIDNDCDGLTDDDDPDALGQWYQDEDGDGYGTGEQQLLPGCTTRVGPYAGSPDDCDDDDPTVNPGVEEDCSETDRNCDGDATANAADAEDWYLDADGDAYGLASDRVASCTALADRVADDTDCDDGNEQIHPGAREICDRLDNDCDGEVDDEDDDIDPDTQSIWVYDGDQDGYGTSSPLCSDYVVCQCSQPLCFVDNFDDCDDNSKEVGACGDPSPGDLFACPLSDDPECEVPPLDPDTCMPVSPMTLP